MPKRPAVYLFAICQCYHLTRFLTSAIIEANLKRFYTEKEIDMAKNLQNRTRVHNLILLAVFTALVVVLSFIKIPLGPFSVTLTLPVIVIGGALCGVWAGAWLGAAFSIMVFVTGDAAAFLAINIPATILVVMVKGTAAGLAAAFVYRLLQKNNKITLATLAAAITAPIVNTGIFSIGCLCFFMETIKSWGLGSGYTSGIAYLFLGMIGLNFVVELAVNFVLSPMIIRLIDLVVKKKISR